MDFERAERSHRELGAHGEREIRAAPHFSDGGGYQGG